MVGNGIGCIGGDAGNVWNRIIWKEGCYNPATAMISTYVKSKQSGKDDGLNLSTRYNIIILMLRLDDFLGARAAVMGGFHGLPTTMTVPCNDNGGVGNAKLRIIILSDLAARSLDVPNVPHVINFHLPIKGNGGYDTYMHRGGHAGWLGRRGKVMLLVMSNQEFVLEQLANKLSLDLTCMARQEG
jgi:hypothetical protein